MRALTCWLDRLDRLKRQAGARPVNPQTHPGGRVLSDALDAQRRRVSWEHAAQAQAATLQQQRMEPPLQGVDCVADLQRQGEGEQMWAMSRNQD